MSAGIPVLNASKAPNSPFYVMECDACGGTYEHVNGEYEYCPRCGRRIEVDE